MLTGACSVAVPSDLEPVWPVPLYRRQNRIDAGLPLAVTFHSLCDAHQAGSVLCRRQPTDVVTQAFADHASRALRQVFIIDNMPGANTTLAAQAVASAPL
jgi:hypothetical protein